MSRGQKAGPLLTTRSKNARLVMWSPAVSAKKEERHGSSRLPLASHPVRSARCSDCRGELGMTGAGIGIQGSEVRSRGRASRAGIQPAKPICPLESTDVKKDGTIADLKLRLAPKPSLPRHQHTRRQYEQDLTSSSYRDPVHQSALERQEWNRASRTFAPRPLWESSWCLSGSLVFSRNEP